MVKEKKKKMLIAIERIAALSAVVVTLAVTLGGWAACAEDVEYCSVMDYSSLYFVISNEKVNIPTTYKGVADTERLLYNTSSWSVRYTYSDGYIWIRLRLNDTSEFSAELHGTFNYTGPGDGDDTFYTITTGSFAGTDTYKGYSWVKIKNPDNYTYQGLSAGNVAYSQTLIGGREYGFSRGKNYSNSRIDDGSSINPYGGLYAFTGTIDRYFDLNPTGNAWILKLRAEKSSDHWARLGGAKLYMYTAYGTYPSNAANVHFESFGDFLVSCMHNFLDFEIMPFVSIAGLLACIIGVTGFFVLLRLWGGHG